MEGKTINQMCTTIACAQSRGGFTSAVRAYIVRYLVARYYLVQGSVNHHRRPMQATA